jgi:hypothetical protein
MNSAAHPNTTARRTPALAASALAALAGWAIAQPTGAPASEPTPDAVSPPSEGPSQTSAPNAPGPIAPDAEPEAVVLMRDGQQWNGFLVSQDDEKVLLRIAGIPTRIDRPQIQAVQILPPIVTRYRQMREAISDDDGDRIVLLCEWLRVRGKLDLALAELERLLERQPTHIEGRRLKLLITSQRDMERRTRERRAAEEAARAKVATPQTPNAAPGDQPEPAPGGSAPGPVPDLPTLTPDEINLIRVYEIDLKDSPRLLIDRETITTLLEQHAGDPLIPASPEGRQLFYQAPPQQVLDVMFRIQARSLYPRVRVLGDPKPLKLFRDHVHRTLIMNACATSQCHGGSEAGRLQFITKRPQSDATVYTNFLILERFRTKEGRPLVNYDRPQASPLLQMGLPRDRSSFQHPVVPTPRGKGDAWRPFFRTTEDERFLRALEWVSSMYRPRPSYPINYDPPGQPAGVAKPAAPDIER